MFRKAFAVIVLSIFLVSHAGWASQGQKLQKIDDRSYVCMVNDTLMGKPQIQVKVGELTYYGCCEMCVGTLERDWKTRVAKDPVTGSIVDKTKALIGAKPNGDILYFESEKTFQAFSTK